MRASRILRLGAHEPLLHRALGHEEGAGDLGGLEPAERAQRQRHAGLGGERRVAAGEDQAQPVVGDGGIHFGLLVRGGGCERLELAHLVLQAARPSDAVDRPVAGGRDDPGAGVVRRTPLGPDLERDDEGVLHRLLGEVEVAEHPDERGDRPSRLLAEQAVDVALAGGIYDARASPEVCTSEPTAS